MGGNYLLVPQPLRRPRGSARVAIALGPLSAHPPRRRALARAAVVCCAAVALFAVVLWPSRSFAAIVPACEADFASRVAAPAAEQADQTESSCDAQAADDDIDNSRAAPMCDARGASAVAPPRIHGVSDQRFERHRPCDEGESLRTAVRPGRGDPPAPPPDALAERAILPALELPARPAEARLLDPLARTDGPRAGVRDDVYHPPR